MASSRFFIGASDVLILMPTTLFASFLLPANRMEGATLHPHRLPLFHAVEERVGERRRN
jgi:hypothetical protein